MICLAFDCKVFVGREQTKSMQEDKCNYIENWHKVKTSGCSLSRADIENSSPSNNHQ